MVIRNRYLLLVDVFLIAAAAILSFTVRLDTIRFQRYYSACLVFIILALLIKPFIFFLFGLYRRLWRYASVDEALSITWAVSLSSATISALIFGVCLPLGIIESFPRSVPLIDWLLSMVLIGGLRFSFRLQRGAKSSRKGIALQEPIEVEMRILIIGAGDAGAMLVREMQANPGLGLLPVGFIDDDLAKLGMSIHNVIVLGTRNDIPDVIGRDGIDEAVIAMPTAPGSAIREILAICNQAGVPARTIPGLYDILSGQVSVNQIREVDIEDLLRREPVHTDVSAVGGMLRGRRVLVTGAGGSIGSELCRQIARCEPVALVLMGHGENSIFEIYNELNRGAGETHHASRITYHAVIADVRDLDRLRQVFEAHRPQIVFHTAAHKHVPLMEQNAPEAVTNNVEGTAHLLRLSETHQVDRFVFISTDKAVNPASVMGATKRVAELLVQESARRSGHRHVAVRFGNVLGSRGSVVPLFRQQIARGGPVEVTHPDVRRYFMTIPEAVQLVLQAAALGEGGEVFLLDMGEPIRIVDLARDLIELSGLEVGRDVDIVYTRLRPGEKLFEELFVEGEEYVPTPHEKIFISHNAHDDLVPSVVLTRTVEEVIELARQGDDDLMRVKLKEIVPEYSPAGAPKGGQPRSSR
jgi:FlaA1/EpsC-like NDP-sugar epimerase